MPRRAALCLSPMTGGFLKHRGPLWYPCDQPSPTRSSRHSGADLHVSSATVCCKGAIVSLRDFTKQCRVADFFRGQRYYQLNDAGNGMVGESLDVYDNWGVQGPIDAALEWNERTCEGLAGRSLMPHRVYFVHSLPRRLVQRGILLAHQQFWLGSGRRL